MSDCVVDDTNISSWRDSIWNRTSQVTSIVLYPYIATGRLALRGATTVVSLPGHLYTRVLSTSETASAPASGMETVEVSDTSLQNRKTSPSKKSPSTSSSSQRKQSIVQRIVILWCYAISRVYEIILIFTNAVQHTSLYTWIANSVSSCVAKVCTLSDSCNQTVVYYLIAEPTVHIVKAMAPKSVHGSINSEQMTESLTRTINAVVSLSITIFGPQQVLKGGQWMAKQVHEWAQGEMEEEKQSMADIIGIGLSFPQEKDEEKETIELVGEFQWGSSIPITEMIPSSDETEDLFQLGKDICTELSRPEHFEGLPTVDEAWDFFYMGTDICSEIVNPENY